MKFLSESKFYETVNQWVRDGSNIEHVVTGSYGVVVELRGKDACMETLALYFKEEDFRRSGMTSGEEKVLIMLPEEKAGA